MSDPLTPEEEARLRAAVDDLRRFPAHTNWVNTVAALLATLDAERARWDGMIKEHARLVDEVNAVRMEAKKLRDRLDAPSLAERARLAELVRALPWHLVQVGAREAEAGLCRADVLALLEGEG